MVNVTVQYPSVSADISESDLEVLRAFDGTVAHDSVTLFMSTGNPEWVVESGEHTSPLCCLRIGRREVLRRTVAELRAMTGNAFQNALVDASFIRGRG